MEVYRVMIGAEVSNPMTPEDFEFQVKIKKIKSKTKVHLQSLDSWVDASALPLFNDIKARVKKEAEEQAAQKSAEKRIKVAQAKKQKAVVSEMNKRAAAMKPAKTPGKERPVKRRGIRGAFCEWILVQAESLIFILFWVGLLAVLLFGVSSTIGFIATFESVAVGMAVGIFGILFGLAIYVVLFVCSAAPVIALLRIAENTRIMAEQL